MSMKFFEEFDQAMAWLEKSDDVNVILVRWPCNTFATAIVARVGVVVTRGVAELVRMSATVLCTRLTDLP